jgi:hypothetical protein
MPLAEGIDVPHGIMLLTFPNVRAMAHDGLQEIQSTTRKRVASSGSTAHRKDLE